MTPAEEAFEQGKAAIAAQKRREEEDMSGIEEKPDPHKGEGRAPITRAQQVVMDLTGTAAKDLVTIQAALDAERGEGQTTGRQEVQRGMEAFKLGQAEAEARLAEEAVALKEQVKALEVGLKDAEQRRDALASEAGGKTKAVQEAEGILLGQEDVIKGLRAENEKLRSELDAIPHSEPQPAPLDGGVPVGDPVTPEPPQPT